MGELNGLRSDCVDLKRSRIFVNRSLTVLKGGLVLEHPNTKVVCCWIGLPLQRNTGKKRGESDPGSLRSMGAELHQMPVIWAFTIQSCAADQ